ncbi:hypothetical protein Cni_G23385 [Canna indica]|uniref:Uncharacterized protein n=1 Tax=Canna indica TaxID=4628 RepID=A0AAQ3KTY3_9LILI|nr:hypothetical protein Cni_G23385 [Canna indica]
MNMSGTMDDQHLSGKGNKSNKAHTVKDGTPWTDLWIDGLICAFEFVRVHKSASTEKCIANTHSTHSKNNLNTKKQVSKSESDAISVQYLDESEFICLMSPNHNDATLDPDGVSQSNDSKGKTKRIRGIQGGHWVPIGWARISELVQMVQVDASWSSQKYILPTKRTISLLLMLPLHTGNAQLGQHGGAI